MDREYGTPTLNPHSGHVIGHNPYAHPITNPLLPIHSRLELYAREEVRRVRQDARVDGVSRPSEWEGRTGGPMVRVHLPVAAGGITGGVDLCTVQYFYQH